MSLIDHEELRRRTHGDAGVIAEIVAIFLDECASNLETLRLAVAEGDGDEVERVAHRMKGMLANLSAHAASRAAATLESSTRSGDATGALAGLVEAIELVTPELRELT